MLPLRAGVPQIQAQGRCHTGGAASKCGVADPATARDAGRADNLRPRAHVTAWVARGLLRRGLSPGCQKPKIMDHIRRRDLQTMQGYVRRAKRLSESQVRKLGL